MVLFGVEFVDATNKSETHDHKCNFSPVVLLKK